MIEIKNILGDVICEIPGKSPYRANKRPLDLRGHDLSYADLTDAYLPRAKMSHTNFKGANLINANLRGADMTYSDMSKCNFYRANLHSTNFFRANLFGSSFISSLLSYAVMRETNLSFTDVVGANLSWADLQKANVYCANFHDSVLDKAILSSIDLDVIGLPIKGNGKEIKSIDIIPGYPITYTKHHLKAGCLQRTLNEWSDSDTIVDALDVDEFFLYKRHADTIFNIVDTFPAE